MKTKNSKANPQAQMAVRCSALLDGVVILSLPHPLNDVPLRGADINSEMAQCSRRSSICLVQNSENQMLWLNLLL